MSVLFGGWRGRRACRHVALSIATHAVRERRGGGRRSGCGNAAAPPDATLPPIPLNPPPTASSTGGSRKRESLDGAPTPPAATAAPAGGTRRTAGDGWVGEDAWTRDGATPPSAADDDDDPWAWVPPDAAAAAAGASTPDTEPRPQRPCSPRPKARRPPPRRRPPPSPGSPACDEDEDLDGWSSAAATLESEWGGGGGGAPGAPPPPAPRASRATGGAWTAAADRATASEADLASDGYGEETGGGKEGDGDASTTTHPDVTPLTAAEVETLLPIIPAPDQVAYFNADGATVLQRAGLCLLVTLATAKAAPAAAAGALTGPLWWPLLAAASRNRRLRTSGQAVGLWRARVLEANVSNAGGGATAGGRRDRRRATARAAPAPPLLTLVVGDDSGATCELRVPYTRAHDGIRVGEGAELLVVATAPRFSRFRALREAYLPGAGLWVADYPAANRREFVRVSLAVEEERAAEREEWGGEDDATGRADDDGAWQEDAWDVGRE